MREEAMSNVVYDIFESIAYTTWGILTRALRRTDCGCVRTDNIAELKHFQSYIDLLSYHA